MKKTIILMAIAAIAICPPKITRAASDPQAARKELERRKKEEQALNDLKKGNEENNGANQPTRALGKQSSDTLNVPSLNTNDHIGITTNGQPTQPTTDGKWVSEIVVPLTRKQRTQPKAPVNSLNRTGDNTQAPSNQQAVLPGAINDPNHNKSFSANSLNASPSPRSYSESQQSKSIQKAAFQQKLQKVKDSDRRMLPVQKLKDEFVKRFAQKPPSIAKAAKEGNMTTEAFIRRWFDAEYRNLIHRHPELLKPDEFEQKIPSQEDLWNDIKFEAKTIEISHDCYARCGCSIQ